MGFCSCFNKTILIILNFIVFAVGITVIALASVVIHRGSTYQELLLNGTLTLPIWTLIVGIIVTLLGFFGCCGAIKENRCMLYTYAAIVTALFVAEVTLGILVAIYPKQAEAHIKSYMMESFKKYEKDDPALTRAIDGLQHDLECCGVTDYRDWTGILGQDEVPKTCCKDQLNCVGASDPNLLYQEGCYDAILDDLEGVTVALGVTAIILAIVQIAGICIACGLAQKRSQYV